MPRARTSTRETWRRTVGGKVEPQVKAALQAEAEARGLKLCTLVAQILREAADRSARAQAGDIRAA